MVAFLNLCVCSCIAFYCMCAFACTMWCEWGEKTFSWFHNVLVSRRLGLDKRGLLVPHATLFFSKAKSLVLQANESDIPEWVWGIKYQIPYLKTKQNCFSFSLDILSKRENLAGRIFFGVGVPFCVDCEFHIIVIIIRIITITITDIAHILAFEFCVVIWWYQTLPRCVLSTSYLQCVE